MQFLFVILKKDTTNVNQKFINDKGEQPEYTDYQVYDKFRDHKQDAQQELASYFGETCKRDDTGELGAWPKDESGLKLYYYVDPDENRIRRFFVTEVPPGMYMSDMNNALYVMELNNKMVCATPQERDIITDNMAEAVKILKKIRDERTKIQREPQIMSGFSPLGSIFIKSLF